MSAAQAEEAKASVTVLPARYAWVDGDNEKFRAHHWMNDGAAGGIKEFSASRVFDDGLTLEADGHAIIGNNDFGTSLLMKKEGTGYLKLGFNEFRKYYDGTGGVYKFFTMQQAIEAERDLALDIGKFAIDTALETPGGGPVLGIEYAREYRDGVKSRLTWGAVTGSGITRNIAPSWQEVDERVDRFALKANDEIAGFAVGARQEWEFTRAEYLREERNHAAGGSAANNKIRRQDQAPEANLMMTTLDARRNLLNDKAFYSTAYRFAHMDNREFETIIETNAAGTVTNFSNPKQIRDARADNDYDTHTWVNGFTASPWKCLTLGSKLKAEIIRRESSSSYPADAAPNSAGGSTPNGVIDQRVVSLNESRAVRWGEGLSARFTGIPRTALYTELELEQSRVRLSEDRKDMLGVNAGETFNRLTIADSERGTGTLGGQVTPWQFLTMTTHLRRRVANTDYDDQRETDPTGSTARSAFMDGQKVVTDELATRLAWKPCAKVQPSVRYQVRDEDYSTRIENEPTVETAMVSHIITLDLALQPLDNLSTLFSFSRQLAHVTTPARYGPAAGGATPPFKANVDSWLASADYALMNGWSLNGSLQFSMADNFNDFGNDGLPLGADFRQLDAAAGLRKAVGDDASVGVEYAFYRYQGNSNVEAGDYDAHVVWLEGTKRF